MKKDTKQHSGPIEALDTHVGVLQRVGTVDLPWLGIAIQLDGDQIKIHSTRVHLDHKTIPIIIARLSSYLMDEYDRDEKKEKAIQSAGQLPPLPIAEEFAPYQINGQRPHVQSDQMGGESNPQMGGEFDRQNSSDEIDRSQSGVESHRQIEQADRGGTENGGIPHRID